MVLKNKTIILPVLLCGGSGTRLWPMSRHSFPKQFLTYGGDKNKNTFLQETLNRLIGIPNLGDPIIICNSEHRFIVAEQMREINFERNSILLEPFSRNTAPAITLAALKAKEIYYDNDPILLVLPADHSIKKIDKFKESIKKCINYVNHGLIMTFGINPSSPETGYGYIEVSECVEKFNEEAFPIKKFIEKPNRDEAKKLILNKKYLWNSGIFFMKTSVVLSELKKFSPEIFFACKDAFNKNFYDLDFQRIKEEPFKKCPNISFDFAVMEKTKLANVFPIDVNWSDVGSWDSLWDISKKDKNGNVLDGNILIKEVKNSYLRSTKRLIVGLDISDLIIVDTFDAILVTKRGSGQKIKDVVEKLKKEKYAEAIIHKKVFRPWGSYESIAEGQGWQVKRINVKQGASLSLQKHEKRTEHWIVVRGVALVEIENKKNVLNKNESTYIPLGFKHRLSNIGENELIIIEVQSGSYLGEDDIVRFKDDYGRKK